MQTTVKVEKARNSNPISKRHFEQVIKRSPRMRDAMIQIWGLTWELLGRRFIPLGQASALVQYADADGPQQVCVVAEQCGDEISYNRVRMVHDWSRNPHPGATSRRLDPREKDDPTVQPGERPNASWVRAGLLVDLARSEATRASYDLASVPGLPGFCYAYSQKPEYSGDTSYLTDAVDPTPRDRPSAADVNGWEVAARAAFDEQVISPEESGLGVYLAPFEVVAVPGRHCGIYEDFTAMRGRSVSNPVLDLTGLCVENPVWQAAKSRRIHLRTLLAELSQEQGDEILETCDILKSGMRDALGVTADAFTDGDLTEALLHPDYALTSTKGIVDLSVADRAQRIHDLLSARNPYVLADATDDDLLKAAAEVYSPLTLSKACAIQTLYRDPRRAPLDTLDFGATALNRPGVTACFAAPDNWKPTKRSR